MKTEREIAELSVPTRPEPQAPSASVLDYATCDPSVISSHSIECACSFCERTGGGLWLQLAALEGRVPLDAPICDAIPVLRGLILDNVLTQRLDAA